MNDPFYEKGLPQEIEAERSVLGGILLDENMIDDVQEGMKPDWLFLDSHRRILKAMISCHEKNRMIDLVLLSSELRQSGEFEQVGGATYISSLIDGVPRTDNLKPYFQKIEKAWINRRIISEALSLMNAAFDNEDAYELLGKAEAKFYELGETRETRQTEAVGVVAERILERQQYLASKPGHILGTRTRYTDLDQFLNGLEEGYYIIAARPAMGKTSLATNIGEHIANDTGIVLDFSMEMNAERRVARMLSSQARVDAHRLRTGYLNREEWARLADALRRMTPWKYHIDDTPGLTIPEMRAKARRFKKKMGGLDLIIIDQLGHVETIRKESTEQQEAKEVSRGVLSIAKELHVPVIALHQLNRACETRKDEHGGHRPNLSDLRDSGNYEQDADVVIGLYRDEYYFQTDENRGTAEAIILKNRDGFTGTVNLAWIQEFTKFENMWHEVINTGRR